MNKISLRIRVGVDDSTAGRVVITSKDAVGILKN